MALLNLPCEILLSITEQCDDPRDILSFACITRATYSILRDLVYKSCAQQRNCTALHYAAKHNNRDIAESLLRHGANINSNLKSSTALLVAAAFGSESIIDLFLARMDTNVNARNVHGETALWHAAYGGRMCAVVRLLQRQDLDVDVADTFHGMTPLALAVSHGHLGVVEALLGSDKVNINARDKGGSTPLHHAVVSKQRESALLLLTREGIDIHVQDDDGHTPFWYAARCGYLGVAQQLLIHGANPNLPDPHGITPLQNAVWGRETAIVSLLLDQHDLEIRSSSGWAGRAQPPLIAAICIGDTTILSMLLCRGAKVNIYSPRGYHPLQLAVQRRDLSMVNVLLDREDISVNDSGWDRHGFTALHQAAYDGCLPIVDVLLGHVDINVNAKDAEGRSPLWWATQNGHSLVINRLVAESDTKANDMIEDQPPLHHAVDRRTMHPQRRRVRLIRKIPIRKG